MRRLRKPLASIAGLMVLVGRGQPADGLSCLLSPRTGPSDRGLEQARERDADEAINREITLRREAADRDNEAKTRQVRAIEEEEERARSLWSDEERERYLREMREAREQIEPRADEAGRTTQGIAVSPSVTGISASPAQSERNVQVEVRLFAVARQRLGRATLAITLPDGSNVGDLRSQIARSAPELAGLLPGMMIAVDSDYADDDRPIAAGSEVAVIPPVSGGCDGRDHRSGDRFRGRHRSRPLEPRRGGLPVPRHGPSDDGRPPHVVARLRGVSRDGGSARWRSWTRRSAAAGR